MADQDTLAVVADGLEIVGRGGSTAARSCSGAGRRTATRSCHRSVFGSERLTGALLDRLTHHILEMNGDSVRRTVIPPADR